MKKLLPFLCAAALFSVSALAAPFKIIHVGELEKLLQESRVDTTQKTVVFDANNETTRQNDGVIPGAVLLKSFKDYKLTVLPAQKDANVVFYCANEQCMASHKAAERAANAGYANVYVMGDGIQGWKKAGKPTNKF
jgi:rhodanese-related sulfurtransferase